MNPTIISHLESVDRTITYCMGRHLKTRVGKNVLWNITQARILLRSSLTMLKKMHEEEKKDENEKVVQILKKFISQIEKRIGVEG